MFIKFLKIRTSKQEANKTVSLIYSIPIFISIPLYFILALVEELIFRSFIFYYISIYSDRIIGLIVSSFLFALLHFNYKYKMIQIFTMGIILCLLVWWTNNIIVSAIAHFVNNIIILFYFDKWKKIILYGKNLIS
jgi:membrane protease YdiL (CAAX protease family)